MRVEASGLPSGATPTLHLVCGKIASGKSTLAKRLAMEPSTVRIAEDEWLSQLFPGEIRSLQDFVRCSEKLRKVMAPHVVALLSAGLSIALDFHCNTPAARQWAKEICELAGATHQLHFLDVSDEVCKERLAFRNLTGDHRFRTTEAQFDEITKHFVAPAPDEDFNIVRD